LRDLQLSHAFIRKKGAGNIVKIFFIIKTFGEIPELGIFLFLTSKLTICKPSISELVAAVAL
jgi:hypothetical protein